MQAFLPVRIDRSRNACATRCVGSQLSITLFRLDADQGVACRPPHGLFAVLTVNLGQSDQCLPGVGADLSKCFHRSRAYVRIPVVEGGNEGIHSRLSDLGKRRNSFTSTPCPVFQQKDQLASGWFGLGANGRQSCRGLSADLWVLVLKRFD